MSGPAAPARRKSRQLEATVADVRPETPDTVTLVLATGGERPEYLPGQFCTIDPHQFPVLAEVTARLEDSKGKKELPRAYSVTSAPHEPLALTIREERYVPGRTKYPPLLSPLLVQLMKPGSRLALGGFTGPYTLPTDVESRTDHLVHLVAGTGAVPNFSILKHALHHQLALRHTVVCANETWADVCFKQELAELERLHPAALRVVHVLEREPDDAAFSARGRGELRRGGVTPALLAELIPDPKACFVFACGPAITTHQRVAAREQNLVPEPRFMERVLEQLTALGVPGDRVRRESWG